MRVLAYPPSYTFRAISIQSGEAPKVTMVILFSTGRTQTQRDQKMNPSST